MNAIYGYMSETVSGDLLRVYLGVVACVAATAAVLFVLLFGVSIGRSVARLLKLNRR